MRGEKRQKNKVRLAESVQVREFSNSQQIINGQGEPASHDSDHLDLSSFPEQLDKSDREALEEEVRAVQASTKPWGQWIRELMKDPRGQFYTAIGCLVLSPIIAPLAIAAVILFFSAPITAIMQAIQKRRENLIKNSSSASLHATHQESELKVIDQRGALRSQIDHVDPKDELEQPRQTGGGPGNSVRSSSSSLDRMNNP